MKAIKGGRALKLLSGNFGKGSMITGPSYSLGFTDVISCARRMLYLEGRNYDYFERFWLDMTEDVIKDSAVKLLKTKLGRLYVSKP
jgi:hypothetical protein